jgi:hypothetical protein
MLVRINDATLPSGTYNGTKTITTSSGDFKLYTMTTATFSGNTMPTGSLSLIGYVDQSATEDRLVLRNPATDVIGGSGGGGGTLVDKSIMEIRDLFTGAALSLGKFKIKGTVISDRSFKNIVDNNIVIQDTSGGIVVRFTAVHSFDINDVVETINENKDWEFRFQGSRFNFLENRTGDNHTYTDPLTIMQFYQSYHNLNPSIAFFPLLNNVFNNGKSNISFLEATYAGAAFMGNRNLLEFNLPFIIPIQNGFKEEFLKVKDDSYRLEMLNNDSWDWICENRLLSKVNELRIERILS